MQRRQFNRSRSQRLKHFGSYWVHWTFALVAVLLLTAGITLGIIERNLTNTLSLILNALGVVVALLQWLLPTPSHKAASPSQTTSYQGIEGVLPPTDSQTVQQREQVVRDIYTELTQPNLSALVLTGIGGAGKSTVAALVFRYAEEQRRIRRGPFRAKSLWLTINENATMADLAGTIFAALGKELPDLSHLSPHNQARALFNVLDTAKKPRLVILDQFENLLDWQTGRALADRPGVGEWLDAINSQPCACRILLTSRPHPRGARTFLPAYMHEYQITGLEVNEGIALLKQQGVEGTEVELRKAVEQCNGHAYALTLLAFLLRHHHLRLSAVLADPTYSGLWLGDIAQNILDYIYTRQLTDSQRVMLQAFSIYREPVPIQAAQALLDPGVAVPRAQLLSALQALHTQHLLQAVDEGRYQLHPLVASYTQAHFHVESERVNQQMKQAAHAKAAQYYVQQAAESCPPRGRRQRSSDIHLLIEAIWQWCQAEQWQEAFHLMEREAIFADLGRWGGNAILLELCRLLLPIEKWHPTSAQEARLYSNLGEVYRVMGQMKPAQEYLELALMLYQQTGNRKEEGWIFTSLGRVYYELGHKERAEDYYERARALQREVGDRAGEATTLIYLGRVYDRLEQMERGQSCFREALRITREIKDRRGEGWALYSLGNLHNARGPSDLEKRQARDDCEEAVRLLREVGDREREGWALTTLGRAYNALGEQQRAQQCYEEALRVHREVGNRRAEGWTFYNLGKSLADSEQYEQARQYYQQALTIQREVEDRWDEAITLNQLGWLSLAQEQHEQARVYYQQSLDIRSELGDQLGMGRTLKNLARVYSLLGLKEQALEGLSQALRINKTVGDREGEARTLLALGLLSLEEGRHDVALASFLGARRLREQGSSRSVDETKTRLEELQKTIGEEQFAALSARVEPHINHIIAQRLGEST